MRLAIFAGAGELPAIAVKNARSRGIDFIVYHIREAELDAALSKDTALKRREVSVGALGETFAYLKEDKISQIILLGKIEKREILHSVSRDAVAEKIYSGASDRMDDTLFHQFASLVTQAGIAILEQRELLEGCFLAPGVVTKLKPENPALLADIDFGFQLSRKVGSLDIGQTAVVFEKMVLAVEAIEGTDLAIERAGAILKNQFKSEARRGVVCKSAKASQDPRFDLPTVGVRTLETMAKAGIGCLVIEAAHTLVVDPALFIAKADALGLIVVAK